ncbi:beta-propeller fold lactonase family protein [Vibrio sp. qd031]|uniref:lactonase family protein n=1 Tax=Vibrio sp. qd031 TaxID=1603038 RepID=UPI000A10B44B|nr:beta-propeller fold lactonase family protein [Vibrio sp. qd031]
MQHSMWIGSYSDNDSSQPSYNPGLTQVNLDSISGTLSFDKKTLDRSAISCKQPSYLCSANAHLAVVTEHCTPQVPYLNIVDPKAKKVLSTTEITGDAPCHIVYSEKHQCIAVAHYMGGNITLLDSDDLSQSLTITRSGSGPILHRQESAHLHQVQFLTHSNQLIAVDLGCDEVLLFDLTPQPGCMSEATLSSVITLPAGRGPRHVVLNETEDQLYVLCELSESVCHFRKNDQHQWVLHNELALLENEPTQEAAAAIKLSTDGRTLYTSARAQNKIVSFRVSDSGELSPLQIIDCGGEFPRDFSTSPCGQWMVVGNQHSHTLSVLNIDQNSGMLSNTPHTLSLGSPVCVLF